VKSKWLSRILLLSAGLILGLIGGIILTFNLSSKVNKTATDLFSLSSRAWEANQAMNAYLGDNSEIARYALNHYADILKFYYEHKNQDGFPEATAQDLAFTYIRLGKITKAKEANEFYSRGYAIYKQYRIDSGKEVPSREKLIDLVDKLDAQTKPATASFTDTLTGKNPECSR
jgi:hypothetical protein